MKLIGRKILVKMPEIKESALTLSDADKDAIAKQETKKWNELEVFMVGDEVTRVCAGDKVYIQSYVFSNGLQNVERVLVNGKVLMLFNEPDIAIVW